MSAQNIIYIGRKPVMNYVLAVLTCLNQKGYDEVVLKARGMAIRTAVDVTEVTKRYFNKDLKINVSIGTDQIPQLEGGIKNISKMEIILTNNDAKGQIEKEGSPKDEKDEDIEIEMKEEAPREINGFGFA
jgi:DNA-binding protein